MTGDNSSTAENQLTNLEQLLDRLKYHTCRGEKVSIGAMLDAVGRRSFGPILLFSGLIPASPLSGIPGLPSLTAVLVFIVILQLLTGHHHFWLPEWLLRRQISTRKFIKALDFVRKPACWVDRFIHPRLEYLTTGPAVYVVAVACGLIALLMPPLELVPFANTTTGIALSIFGLALISHDGFLVLLGFAFFVAAVGLAINAMI